MKTPFASTVILVGLLLLSPAPRALGHCWEVGLDTDDCRSVPVRIYDLSTGSAVYAGASQSGCSYEAGQPTNFRIDLNGNCPAGSREAQLPPGSTYLLELDFGGGQVAKARFTPTGCSGGTSCDSTFSLDSGSIWRTSGTRYEFVGYPDAQLLSATLRVTGSQRIGKMTKYFIQATALPNVPASFAWAGISGALDPPYVNPNDAWVNVYDGSTRTATVTVTSDWTRERETVTRSIELGGFGGEY